MALTSMVKEVPKSFQKTTQMNAPEGEARVSPEERTERMLPLEQLDA